MHPPHGRTCATAALRHRLSLAVVFQATCKAQQRHARCLPAAPPASFSQRSPRSVPSPTTASGRSAVSVLHAAVRMQADPCRAWHPHPAATPTKNQTSQPRESTRSLAPSALHTASTTTNHTQRPTTASTLASPPQHPPGPSTPLLEDPHSTMTRAAQTQRILRRTDLHLLPFLSLLFLLNSLDRSNIGNAETAGFTRHAGLQPGDLNDSVALFFTMFVVLQPAGAALGKRVGVARWVGGVMAGWAVLTALTAFVRTRGQLLTLRMLIGTLEAGFYPTTVFYLGLFYTRFEFAQRLGMFFGQYAVAGAFGGLVSWGVFKFFPGEEEAAVGGGGLYAYQVMFLLEGLLTLVVAITTFWWLPVGPGSAWWLQQGDREWAEKRVLLDRAGADQDAEHRRGLAGGEDEEGEELLRDGEEEEELEVIVGKSTIGGEGALTRRDVLEAFRDWKIWWLLAVNISSAVPATAFSVFLPLVIKGMGHPALTANLLTTPPFLCGAFTLWGITYLSDRARQRIKYILLGLAINLVGLLLVVLLPADALAARYLALCVLLAGSYVASPLSVAWLSGNISEPGKRAVVLGINGWGNLAGVVSSRLYAPEYGPSYHVSFVVTLALVMAAFVGYWGFGRALARENEWREKRVKEWTEEEMAAEMRGEGGRRGDERWGVRYAF